MILKFFLKNKKIILVVSFLVVIAVAIFVYLKIFNATVNYYAVVDNVNGLSEKDAVTAENVEIGKVTRIKSFPDITGINILQIKIDMDINIPDKSYGEIIEIEDDHGRSALNINFIASDGYFENYDTIPVKEVIVISEPTTIEPDKIQQNPSVSIADTNEKEAINLHVADNIVFKIQMLVSKDKIPLNSKDFKGVKGVHSYFENGFYKYVVGSEISIDEANKLCMDVKENGFKDAFIIAFRNNERISIKEALRLLEK